VAAPALRVAVSLDRLALHRQAGRRLFRHHVENGVAVTAGLAAVAVGTDLWLGLPAAVLAAIGAACVSIVDLPSPLATKFRQLSAALAGSTLVTLFAGLASGTPWAMAIVVAMTSIGLAFATAFGRPALTLGVAAVLALVIGLALPAATTGIALSRTGLFALGGVAYEALAMLLAALTMDRERRMALNEALIAFAAYVRSRARYYDPTSGADDTLAVVIESHGAVTEKMQAAREIIFGGTRDGRWSGGMVALIDTYEAVLASDADWESLRAPAHAAALRRIEALTRRMADDIDALALALVAPLAAVPAGDYAAPLFALDEVLHADGGAGGILRPTREKLARALRCTAQLADSLSAGGAVVGVPSGVDVAVFLQPPPAILATLRAQATLTSPVARYAIRLTLAMLAGYGLTLVLPRYVHGGWVLLTVALIMRTSYAVTRQRRNDRLLGTLAGCALAAVLMPVLPERGIVACIIIGVGVSHAYASVNYRITSFAASAMALLLLHFLEPQTGFIAERIVDTLIGVGICMLFARVLPSWEWRDVPRLVDALLDVDRRFAILALERAPPEQAYRLARKRALDAFTTLATTIRRLASEPKRQAGNLPALNRLLAANYLLASDLVSVQSLLRARSAQIDEVRADHLLQSALERVRRALSQPGEALAAAEGALRRRGWADLGGTDPVVYLRRRLLHIERSAARLAEEAGKARDAAP